MAYFLAKNVEILNRHTEPKNPMAFGLKHEEVKIIVELISSGNTKDNVSNIELTSSILKKLEKVP